MDLMNQLQTSDPNAQAFLQQQSQHLTNLGATFNQPVTANGAMPTVAGQNYRISAEEQKQGITNAEICHMWPSTRLRPLADFVRPRNRFFSNTFFNRKEFQDEEAVMWRRYYRTFAMMPESCPCDPAPVGDSNGSSEVYMAEFGHFALKTTLQPCKAPERLPSQAQGIPWMRLPPRLRVALKLAEDLEYLEDARQNRIEHMVIEMLTKGEMTVPVYDQIEKKFIDKNVVNFKRCELLQGGSIEFPCTDDKCVDPLVGLRDCARQINCSEPGALADTIILGWQACDELMKNPRLCEMMEKNGRAGARIYDLNFDLTPNGRFGGVEFKGRLGNWDIWCHSDFKECGPGEKDKAIEDKEFLFPPDGMLMLDSSMLGGFQLYGPTATCNTMVPVERLIQTWEVFDPDQCWTKMSMTMIPLAERINASAFKTVKISGKATTATAKTSAAKAAAGGGK